MYICVCTYTHIYICIIYIIFQTEICRVALHAIRHLALQARHVDRLLLPLLAHETTHNKHTPYTYRVALHAISRLALRARHGDRLLLAVGAHVVRRRVRGRRQPLHAPRPLLRGKGM